MDDILIVDDKKDIRFLVSEILEDQGYQTRAVPNGEECFREVNASPPGLVILDIWLQDPEMDGLRIMKILKENNPEIPIIIISAHGNIEIAVRAMRQGAYDYIEKPIMPAHLLKVVGRTMETVRLRRENAVLRMRELNSTNMIGSSQGFRNLKSKLDKIAPTNARVLLSGPPGAGKQLAARYLHAKSHRARGPFISVTPASIDPDHMREALFGKQESRLNSVPGFLEQAHGGTIFFDEVSEVLPEVQLDLLGALVHQQFQRVDGTDKVRVEFRVISSTSKDLEREVQVGQFREDLYHRLNVASVPVPSLENRRDDIAGLATHFVEHFHKCHGFPMRNFSHEAMLYIQTASWPGNIRQLKNLIERVLIMGDSQGPITREEIGETGSEANGGHTSGLSAHLISMPLRDAREAFEREYLITQINRFGCNISRAASFIGMERSALHRKLKSLNVKTVTKAGSRVAEFRDVEAGALPEN